MSSDLPPLEQYVAIDCESVQTRAGQVLAKVGIVDHAGSLILESFVYVHPDNVVDYVTYASGIRPGDLSGAPTFETLQPRIKALLKDKILVGHTLFNDLAYIQHRHPYELTRDTALFYPFRELLGVSREGQYPSLKGLCRALLGREIQSGEHCPVEDARATMALFMRAREEYERGLQEGREVQAGVPASFEKWYW